MTRQPDRTRRQPKPASAAAAFIPLLAALAVALLTACVHVIERPGGDATTPNPTLVFQATATPTPIPTDGPPGSGNGPANEPGAGSSIEPGAGPGTGSRPGTGNGSGTGLATGLATEPPAPFPSPTPAPTPPATPTATIPPTDVPAPLPTMTPTPTATATPPPSSPAAPTGTPTPEPTLDPGPENPPFLIIESPDDRSIIRTGSVTIRGITSEGASVSAKGHAVAAGPEGRFQLSVPLAPGENVMEVFAINPDGARQSKTLTVTYFPLEPFFLTITEPNPLALAVDQPTVRLSGRTASDATVAVNGISIPVDQLGIFSTNITLQPGLNVINVVASNPMGNILEDTLEVTFQEPQSG